MFLFILYVLFLLGSELQLLIWIMKSEGWVNTLFPAVSYIYIYTYIYYASCCNKCKGPVSSVSFPITFCGHEKFPCFMYMQNTSGQGIGDSLLGRFVHLSWEKQ